MVEIKEKKNTKCCYQNLPPQWQMAVRGTLGMGGRW